MALIQSFPAPKKTEPQARSKPGASPWSRPAGSDNAPGRPVPYRLNQRLA